MAKTVQLSEEAYRSLAAAKAPGESFSDTVLRVLQASKDPGNLLRLGPRLPGWDLRAVRNEDQALEAERDRRLARQRRGNDA